MTLRSSLALLLLVLASACFGQSKEDLAKQAYREIVGDVRLENLRGTYRTVAGFGSRLAGTEGERKTFEFAEREFRRLGLKNIRRQAFRVTVPDPDALGRLTVSGQSVTVYPLYPNLARTSTCDVSGAIVYGGNGSLESLRGLSVKDAIVLLEFNSGSRWRNAAKLGAKAVVFLQPDEMPRSEAEAKFAAVPLDVPRFYLPLRNAGPVIAAALKAAPANLVCRQDWVESESFNLVADLDGSDPRAAAERVVVFGYADAMSVVPAIAPGAESIGNLAAMIELARVWQSRPHRRPIRFVLSGAHGLALQGVREYVQSLIDTDAPGDLLTVTLDLASGSRTLGSYGRGWFFDYRDEPQAAVQQISRLLRSHADQFAPIAGAPSARLVLTDAVNQGDGRTWKNNIPGKFALDCEPLLNASMNALTFATIEDGRDRVDTPFDTLDKVNLANVHRQTQTLGAMLHHLLNDPSNTRETSDYRVPLRPAKPVQMSLYGGFATVRGNVVLFDPNKSFVPDEPVPGAIAFVRGRQKSMMGVRGDMTQLTQGKKAFYRFVGLAPQTSYWGPYQTRTRLAAFRIDPKTGGIDHAASFGFFGDFSYPTEFMLKVTDRFSPLVVFKCVTVSVYDLVDPQDLKALSELNVLDATTDSRPADYGIFSPPQDQRLNPDIEDSQVLFLQRAKPFKLFGGSSVGETRLILTNSSVGDDAGKGYFAPGGPVDKGRASIATGGLFPDTALNAARDIANINQTRLDRFEKYRIISQGISDLQKETLAEIGFAEEAQRVKDWPAADRHARAAWGYGLRAHPVIQKTSNDVVNGVVFYLFLLIPFSYFIERLAFGNRLLTKQLGAVVGIFLCSFVLLRLIHPAFEIVSNPAMIFVAFVMGSLSLIVITFILGKFESSLRLIKQAQSGVTEVDIRRGSVAMAAFNLGVSNMRRRKARTLLTTLTLVVMTFIVLSFTSIVSELQLNEYPSPNEAKYPGILIRNPGLDPLQLNTYRQVQSEFSGRASVARRAMYYGADIGETGVLTLQRADRVAEVRAMLGLEPTESQITAPQEALVAGRWFRPGETNVMILPTPLAEQLKVEPKEVGKATVKYAGMDYTVIGIADPSILRGTSDLDGDGILPPDFSLSRKEQQESNSSNAAFRSYIRLDPSTVFILPAETALGLGADLRTIGIRFEDASATRKALDALMPRLRLNLYASVPKTEGSNELEVRQFSVFQASKGTGLILVVVQLVIAAIFVLNTMIASVYERTKEISIFSSIGLAPNHIAMLFFAESLVYGVLGAVVGYFCAQGTAKFIVATNSLPGLTLNFSSTSAVMSAGIVMGIVLLSTIYPARKAAQIAAPAMNDEVFETEPEGDVWHLPLPFSIGAAEAAPLTQFLGEWLRAYEEYTIGDFVSSGTRISSSDAGEMHAYQVNSVTWLAPYDLGISQELELVASPSSAAGIYRLDLKLTRLAGDPENWPAVNRRFLANVRKQFLTWRTLTPEQREGFEQRAEESFRRETASV